MLCLEQFFMLLTLSLGAGPLPFSFEPFAVTQWYIINSIHMQIQGFWDVMLYPFVNQHDVICKI
jgi:hypothetical protein